MAGRRLAMSRRLDTPAVPAAVAGFGGLAFVLLRLATVAKGNLTKFVFAGSDFVNPAAAPRGLYVYRGTGYDGQFYYRLALDPANLSRTAFGITLDTAFRVQRIGMPVLSWLAAVGQRQFVPESEVGVNLAALVILAWLGGVIAMGAGRHAAWGLLVAGYWGFLFSIGRDLPEVVASCFLVGGILALRRVRPLLAGCLFAGAALTIETTLDVVIAIGLVYVFQLLVRRRSLGRRDLAWIVPGVAFVGWQLVCWAVVGKLPVHADTGDNLSFPVVDMVSALGHYVSRLPSQSAALWLGELFVLAVVTIIAGWSVLRARIPSWEKVAWGVAALVALSLSKGIWYGTADFRGFEDVYLLSALVLLGSKRRLWLPALLVVIAWVVTFSHRVVSL